MIVLTKQTRHYDLITDDHVFYDNFTKHMEKFNTYKISSATFLQNHNWKLIKNLSEPIFSTFTQTLKF